MPEFYAYAAILLVLYFAAFFVVLGPLFNWSGFGQELLLSEKLFQKLYPKSFLRKILRNVLNDISRRGYYGDIILDLILYARTMNWQAEEKIGWAIFEKRNMRSEIMSALGEAAYLPIHQELLQMLSKESYPEQAYYDLMCRKPEHYPELPQAEYRDWAWNKLLENPSQQFLAFVAERFPQYQQQAWSILTSLPDNRWALYYLVQESEELRLPAWTILKQQLETGLIQAKSKLESKEGFFTPNTQASWAALRDLLDIKKSLEKLWKFEEISDEAWSLATSY